MHQNCSFCMEPCVIHCMNRSLHHKHNEEQDKSGAIIDQILSRAKTASYIKYVQVVIESDARECFLEYLRGEPYRQQFDHLQEYYKFRIYVPLFARSRASDTVLSYYYQKLKHYYNNIKRKLHITVDPSSSSEFSSLTQSNISTKEELLKDIKYELEFDKRKKAVPNIMNYKSQSKALEELVSYLKLNSHFQQIKTLKTEDCFGQQELFKETSRKRENPKFLFEQPVRLSFKPRIIKKMGENGSGRKTPLPNDSKGQRPPSRSKSIKAIKLKQTKQIAVESQRNSKFSSPFRIREQQVLRESRNNNSLNKRYSSVGRLTPQQHYSSPSSPYKRKSLTKEKGKTTSLTSVQAKPKTQAIEQLRLKNDEKAKLKQSILKIQMMKIQNEVIKNKTTPNSPTSRKFIKQNLELVKNDNILSIRKKKLQILKEKAHKK